MATKPLEATVRQEGRAAVISLRGEIDSFGEETLNKAYDAAEALGTSAILLNFTGVDYINSTGIALIVALLARARNSGRRPIAASHSTAPLKEENHQVAEGRHELPEDAPDTGRIEAFSDGIFATAMTIRTLAPAPSLLRVA